MSDEPRSVPADYTPRPLGESDPERLEVVSKRFRLASSTDLSPRRRRLMELADTTRELIDRLVATDAPDEVIDDAVEVLRGVVDSFAGYHQGSLYGLSEMANAGSGADPLFDHSPLIGIANPLSPPLRVREENQEIVAEGTFGQAYEGPPGCVHGGYVAASFDEVLGAAQSLSGAPGMTGTLTVRYESPTPLRTELRFVGRLVGVERRKIFTEGECWAGDRLTATAKGTFIALAPGTLFTLLAEREALGEERR